MVQILLGSGGTPLTQQDIELDTPLDYDARCFFLHRDRVELYRRIDARCEDMMLGGLVQVCVRRVQGVVWVWVDTIMLHPTHPIHVTTHHTITQECCALLQAGIKVDTNSATRAIGYRQLLQYLETCIQDPAHINAKEMVCGCVHGVGVWRDESMHMCVRMCVYVFDAQA